MYIHEDSEMCKFDNKCARHLCLYKNSYDQAEIIEYDTNLTFQNPYLLEKFECDACGFDTTDRKEFELHIDEVKRICPVCKKKIMIVLTT